MSARNELARLIAVTKYPNLRPSWEEREDRSPVKYFSLKQADAILAAGYRKPRTITTAEDLDALPFRSVVRDHYGRVFHRWLLAGWQCAGMTLKAEIVLPATVLDAPEPTP